MDRQAREEIQVLEALLTELQRNHQSIVDRERQLERTFDEIRSSPEAMSREDEEYLQNVYPQTLASVRAAIQESQEVCVVAPIASLFCFLLFFIIFPHSLWTQFHTQKMRDVEDKVWC